MADDDAMLLEGNTQIDVQVCYSCGAVHEKLHCQPYCKTNPPWTHWYTCPANGDPVSICIMLQGDNPVEMNNRILKDLARAQAGGPVLFATFRIERGDILLDRHTFRFPSARLLEAADLLRRDLAKEAPLPEPTGPLPRADLASLFGPGLKLSKLVGQEGTARNGAGSTREDDDKGDVEDSEEY